MDSDRTARLHRVSNSDELWSEQNDKLAACLRRIRLTCLSALLLSHVYAISNLLSVGAYCSTSWVPILASDAAPGESTLMIPSEPGLGAKPAAKYRSQFRIYVDIMHVIQRENNEAKPTRILYGANLSNDRLIKYLEELKSLGVIQESGTDDKLYGLTQKGIEFMNNFRKVESFAEAFGFKI